jgi:hypothetical protein
MYNSIKNWLLERIKFCRFRIGIALIFWLRDLFVHVDMICHFKINIITQSLFINYDNKLIYFYILIL